MKIFTKPTAHHALSLIVIFLIMSSLAMVHDGRLFGHKFSTSAEPEAITVENGIEVVNTTDIGSSIVGYGGPVPVKIYLNGGRIDSVVPLENSETPHFFSKLEREGLMHAWDGKTLCEAADMPVDAVTTATYSSEALIGNVRAGVNYALTNGNGKAEASPVALSCKNVAVIIVILCGALLPLFMHGRRYRLIQQLANAGVLGFWAGTFIDYSMMLNIFANGVTFTMSAIVALLLLAVGLVYPIFGRTGHYCAWICPYGSLQDLASGISRRKVKMGAKTERLLTGVRHLLWVVLLTLLYAGIAVEWIDYEIFTAFIVQSASWTMIGIGLAFVVLSLFVPRPFCRFVCPTGTLLRLDTGSRQK